MRRKETKEKKRKENERKDKESYGMVWNGMAFLKMCTWHGVELGSKYIE